MKAPAFDYLRPKSIDEALAALREHGEGARIIAGGQSLVPLLNMRLTTPSLLVDIGRLSELRGIEVQGDVISIGAMTRHVEIERSDVIRRYAPLLSSTMAHVAYPAVRNRGTFGGAMANADPIWNLPACALALGAVMVARSLEGERRIAADDFFLGHCRTALRPDEILVRVEVPVDGATHRVAFRKLGPRLTVIMGVAARAEVVDGICKSLRLGWFGVGDTPKLSASAANALVGTSPDEAALERAVAALGEDLKPHDDLRGSAAMRSYLARVLLRRIAADLFPEFLSEVRQEATA